MDLRISELPPLKEEDLQGLDLLALADLSASETKRLDAKSFLEAGLQFIDDGAIKGAKLVPDSVTAKEIAPEAITASELADQAVDTASIQNLAVTDGKIAPGVDGAKLTDVTVTAAKIAPTSFDRGLDKATGLIGHTNAIPAGSRSGITFDGQGHITAHRALIGSDLPPATDAELGGVMVPQGGGLQVSNTGVISHSNAVAGATRSGITYDAQGHVTAAVPLVGTDLPNATDTTTGAVMVPSLSLQVLNGVLRHVDSGVLTGVYTKVQVNETGHVIQAGDLVPADIPGLDASIITSGQFGSERLAINSVTAQQLADYGIAHVLQSRPKAEFAGQFWINPVDRAAYIWVGVVDGPGTVENGYWMSLGYGSATDQNARLGGTYDAANNVVESVNQYGNAAGLVIGQALPAPSQANNGVYLLTTSNGVGTTPAPVEALSIGDWVFSLGTGPNWIKIGIISGQSGIIRDDDVLVEGANFNPAMPSVASQFDANTLLWAYAQPASGALRGTVMPSESVTCDAAGLMEVNVVDEGTF
jgi:hypothetical protein